LIRRIFFLIVVLFSAMPLYAAHLKGGYIEYENLGPMAGNPNFTTFRITVYQYLDCNSAGGQIDGEVNLGFYDLDAGTMSTAIIPLTATNISQKSDFKCIDFPPNICYRIDRYQTLQNVANNRTGYLLTVQRCCRISGINNISNSVNAGVTYSVKLFTDLVNGGFIKNASPVFAREDTALVCANSGFTLPFKATDPDRDSLVFSFTPGLNTPSREAKPLPPINPPFPDLVYTGVYNSQQPMGDRVTIDSRTGIINGIAPGTSGDYVVAVLVEEYRNGVKIGETRKEIHISVAGCTSPRAVLPPPPGIINCDNYEVAFSNLSNSPGITSYYWDFGVPGITSDTSTAASPKFVYTDTGVYKVKLVTNRNGLCSDSANTEARVFPGFDPNFSYLGVCNLLPYQFADISRPAYGSVNSWRWDFGDPATTADTSRLKNPTYLFANPGTYNVSLRVTSTKGCDETVTLPVLVSDKPQVQLAFRDTLICSRDTLQLRNLIPGNYSWTPAYNIINPNSANPLVYPKRTTTYTVLMDNSGCKATDSVKVNVVDVVTLNAGADTTICLTDEIQLRPFSDGNSFVWSPAATIDDPTAKNPKVRPTAVQTVYTVIANLGNCEATDQLTVNTIPYPNVNAGADTTICFGERAFLHGSSNADLVRWSPASVVSNSNNLTTTATPINSGYLVLTARNATGCINPISDSVMITVLPRIVLDAGPDTSLVVSQPLQLTGTSSVNSIQWAPVIGLNNSTILNPVLTISSDMALDLSSPLIYTLTATNAAGCTVSSELVIKLFVTGPSIFVPSGFTPNNDGLNDLIRPVLAGMKELRFFRVYNRYGQLIFETKQVGRGWDGRVNGQLQATSSFVYDCEAVDYLDKPARQKGTFTLIR
jgi:gliding motility-associated-like protein